MELDYTLLTYSERLKEVNAKINFKDVNLEQMANYLLNAKDLVKKGKLEYTIFTDRKLFDRQLKERASGLFNDDILDIIVERKNTKKEKKQKIFSVDFKNPILDDYQKFINGCKKIKNNKPYLEQRKIENLMREIKYDQKLAKDLLNGTIYFKHIGSESTENNLDWIDFNNVKHILELLRFNYNHRLDTWFGCVMFSMQEVLDEITFTEKQKEIIDLWKDTDNSKEDIAKILDIKRQSVNDRLLCIANKIKDHYFLCNIYKTRQYLD